MKCRTEQGLVERVNVQSSFATTCTLSDNGTLHKCLHRTVGQHLATVLLLVISVGLGLGTAATEAQTRAYVTNSQDNTVSVIDTATNTVVATVPVGVNPSGIAITPDGTRAYVATELGTVSVIDTATNTVVATIPIGGEPLGIAITPAPQAPTSIKQCEHGGYLKFGPPAGPFKNQGQCVSYVEHH